MMTGLDTGRIFPLVIRLIVPAVIAKLITFLYNIVDRMYVSRMQGSGMDALAALGIVLPITLITRHLRTLWDWEVRRGRESGWEKEMRRRRTVSLIYPF